MLMVVNIEILKAENLPNLKFFELFVFQIDIWF